MYLNISNILRNLTAVLLTAVGLFIGFISEAQDLKQVDSLKARLSSDAPAAKVGDLLALCVQYAGSDKQESYKYVEAAYKLAVEIGDSTRMVQAGRIKGQLLRLLDHLDESLDVLNEVLPVARRNHFTDEHKRILNALAIGYNFKGNYDQALTYNFQSLDIREAEGNKKEISIAYNNIGLVYFKLDDYEKALEYYNKSLQTKADVNDKYDLDRLLINLGLCYNQLKRYPEALKAINEGFQVCGSDCSKQILLEGKYGMGVSLKETGKIDEANQYFNDALNLSLELKDVRFQLECLKSLARIDIIKDKDEEAEKLLKQAEDLASTTAYNQIQIEIYRELSTIYNNRKDYQRAADYQRRYIVLKDSVYTKELIKNLATIQTNYTQRENIRTIADKDADIALKEETLRRRNAESLFYVVVSVLVFILAALMFLLFRLTQRANNLLEDRVEKRTRELNDSNEALAKVNGELDNFIYKTSHDIRGPLASLKGICNVAIMDVKDENALAYLQKLDFTAEKLNRILTRLLIINQINHAVLASNIIVFEELLEDILFLERKKGVPKRLKIFYEIEKGFTLKSDKEMLRIVLENLIDNGIKFYSESDRVDPFVKVFIYSVENQVVIKVIDNGVGISAETREKIFQMFVRASERSETGGIGLYLSRLATGRIEGKIEFRTTPEKYTEFSVKLPLDLAPILEARHEQERIRQFENVKVTEKGKRMVGTK